MTNPRVIAITPVKGGHGTTTLAMALAYFVAKKGKKVVLVAQDHGDFKDIFAMSGMPAPVSMWNIYEIENFHVLNGQMAPQPVKDYDVAIHIGRIGQTIHRDWDNAFRIMVADTSYVALARAAQLNDEYVPHIAVIRSYPENVIQFRDTVNTIRAASHYEMPSNHHVARRIDAGLFPGCFERVIGSDVYQNIANQLTKENNIENLRRAV